MGEGACGAGLGVREEGAVEIQAQPPGGGPLDPAGKMARFKGIAIRGPAARLGIHGMQVDAAPAGDQRQRPVQVGAQFAGGPRPAGIMAGRLKAAQVAARGLEAGDVIALPAVNRDRNAGQAAQGAFGIHAQGGVAFPGQGIGVLRGGLHAGSWAYRRCPAREPNTAPGA